MVSPETKSEVRRCYTLLSCEFRVPVPNTIWIPEMVNGATIHFPDGSHLIQLGEEPWCGEKCLLDIALHEFAHYLLSTQENECYYHNGHNAKFVQTLEKVIFSWYGNYSSYSWDTEYDPIEEFAKQMRYTNFSRFGISKSEISIYDEWSIRDLLHSRGK